MRKYLMLLLPAVYVIQIACFYLLLAATLKSVVLLVCLLVFTLSLMVLNLIDAGRNSKTMQGNRDAQQALNRTILIFKILTIPFYIINFFIVTFATSAVVIIPMFRYLVLILPVLGIFLSYLVLLAGSVQAISLLTILYGEGVISRKKMIWHIVLQLFFVLDVMVYLFLSFDLRGLLLDDPNASVKKVPVERKEPLERKQPLGKYGYGVLSGFWVAVGYMVLLTDKISLLDATVIRWIWALIMVAVCGKILSLANQMKRNMLITVGIAILGWCALVFTDLGGMLNGGFGNAGGYLPGQVTYLLGGVLLILILSTCYGAARLIFVSGKNELEEDDE